MIVMSEMGRNTDDICLNLNRKKYRYLGDDQCTLQAIDIISAHFMDNLKQTIRVKCQR